MSLRRNQPNFKQDKGRNPPSSTCLPAGNYLFQYGKIPPCLPGKGALTRRGQLPKLISVDLVSELSQEVLVRALGLLLNKSLWNCIGNHFAGEGLEVHSWVCKRPEVLQSPKPRNNQSNRECLTQMLSSCFGLKSKEVGKAVLPQSHHSSHYPSLFMRHGSSADVSSMPQSRSELSSGQFHFLVILVVSCRHGSRAIEKSSGWSV